MEKYVALLRGINVGGKNKISMGELKPAFEEYGFENVRTYINSGNVIFSSDIKDKLKLIKIIEAIIVEKFGLDIPVLVVSSKELKDLSKEIPDWWGNGDKEKSHNTIFVLPPKTSEHIVLKMGQANQGFENIKIHKNMILWSVELKKYSKSKWAQINSSVVSNDVTLRNANTTRKLISLMEE